MFRLFSNWDDSGSTTPSINGHSSSIPSHNRHNSSSSTHSSYTVVSRDSESGGGGGGGGAPNLVASATFEEKSVATSTAMAPLDIPTLAKMATVSLDRAEQQIKNYQQQLGPSSATRTLDAHVDTLAEVHNSVQQVMILEDLQTPPVLAALETLKHHVDALETCTRGTGFSLADLDKVMNKVQNAHQNLEDRLPRDHNVVVENKTNGIQFNAPLGGIASRRRIHNEVRGNVVTTANGFQLNAPVYETGKEMFAAVFAARAEPAS